MADQEMYESSMRSREDLGAFFEYDGETSYFYLMEDPHALEPRESGSRIIGHIFILNGVPDFRQEDVAVEWDRDERMVGLFIKGQLWAVFDDTGAKYGGRYRPNGEPDISEEIAEAFKPLTN